MNCILPKRIIKSGGKIVEIENILREKALQIGLNERCTTECKNGFLILDFGTELSGGVRILTYKVVSNGKVRLRFGESVSETCAEIGEKNATNDHSLRDFCVELKNFSDMTFGQTGFRFLRIDFPQDANISIKSIVAASDTDERMLEGSFSCSDETLNKVWDTAANTLRLCLKNGYLWDGIKRDRLVWIGDIYPEAKTAYCMFQNIPEIKNSLIFCRDQTEKGTWMNNIPMYSVWWLYVLCEYYDHTQDKDFVKENLPFIEQIISDVDFCVDKNGETRFPMNFIDWPSHYEEKENEGEEDVIKRYDELAGTNYLIRLVFNKLADLLKIVGADAEKLNEISQRLEKKKYSVKRYKQIAALGVLIGEDVEHNESLIVEGGTKGLTTFLNYFIFKALAKCGRQEDALQMIRSYYGKMIEFGATTFWEDFDVEWTENAFKIDELPKAGKKDIHGDFGRFCYEGFRHSLCHGWSSGVLAYMMEHILGLQSEGNDNTKYMLSPKLCDLEWVQGSYPTPYGIIKIKVTKDVSGNLIFEKEVPESVKLKVSQI